MAMPDDLTPKDKQYKHTSDATHRQCRNQEKRTCNICHRTKPKSAFYYDKTHSYVITCGGCRLRMFDASKIESGQRSTMARHFKNVSKKRKVNLNDVWNKKGRK